MTSAQERFLRVADARSDGRVVGGNPRTIHVLIERGWIEVDGYYFGPLFRISAAGRLAVSGLPSR